MNLFDRVRRVRNMFADRGPLLREDRPLWADTQSLPDLCQLTAQWLEGRIQSQPGYYGLVDVDEEEAPGLTRTLVALNRGGFLTKSSQAGDVCPGYDNVGWEQRASVTGFGDTDTFLWLRDAVAGTRFEVHIVGRAGRVTNYRTAVTVTTRAGCSYTRFGACLSRSAVADEFDGCSDAAIDAVRDAWQVTVFDPEFGPNDLWPLLERAALSVAAGSENRRP